MRAHNTLSSVPLFDDNISVAAFVDVVVVSLFSFFSFNLTFIANPYLYLILVSGRRLMHACEGA
jgi:hypothetical protein